MTTPAPRFFACLPMYDLPELRQATDAWWRGLAGHLTAVGLRDVPETLTRPEGEATPQLAEPPLVIGHTCGYPQTQGLA
ncbi:MAG: hypothetical protein WD100_14420, partial [Tistlia sp.]